MSVFRIEKNHNYTVLSNYHLRDENLSYKAKGLLSFMLSLPEDWNYLINGLVRVSKEGVKAIKSILKELQKYGYLEIRKNKNILGQFEYEYLIYEYPEYPKGEVDLGEVEKDTQINTNIINTKEQIDKDDKTDKSAFFMSENHNPLTYELIRKKYINESDIQIFYYDDLFNKLLENNSYKNLIQIIHYIIPRIISNNFKDENGNIIDNKFGYFKSSILNNLKKIDIKVEKLWDD